MTFRKNNCLEISQETMRDFLTNHFSRRIFVHDEVIVTDVQAKNGGFCIQFTDAKLHLATRQQLLEVTITDTAKNSNRFKKSIITKPLPKTRAERKALFQNVKEKTA